MQWILSVIYCCYVFNIDNLWIDLKWSAIKLQFEVIIFSDSLVNVYLNEKPCFESLSILIIAVLLNFVVWPVNSAIFLKICEMEVYSFKITTEILKNKCLNGKKVMLLAHIWFIFPYANCFLEELLRRVTFFYRCYGKNLKIVYIVPCRFKFIRLSLNILT